jgi:PAS domain S-box-containing protein
MALHLRASGVALLYVLVAGLWIWLTDTLLARLVTDPEQFSAWQTYKGWFFITLTALLFWVERTLSDRRVQDAERRLRERMQERTSELELVRKQLQFILDNAPITFAMRGADNRYMLTNRTWEKTLGVSSADALGKTPYELFPPEIANELTQALERIWEKKEGVLEEVSMRLHGRNHVFMRASFPLFDDQGKPYAGIGLVTDISERKAVEESLRQAEERFRAIFQTVGVGINLVSPTGHYVGANPAFQRMLGYSEAELVGKHFREVTYPPDLVEDERVTKQIEEQPHETAEVEKRYVRVDGSLVWTRLLISAIRNSDGTLATYVTVVEEITARKEAEAQQQRAQAELERLVAERTVELQHANNELAEAQRIAHVGNWNIDLASNRLEWSAETYRIFGYEPYAFEGSRETFLAGVHPDDRPLAEWVRQEALAGMPMDYEHRVVRPNGEIRTVHERGYVVRNETGKATRIFGTVQDITERKKAEEEIRAINARLSAILQASPLGIVAMDAKGIVELWNPAAEQIYGYPAEDVLGKVVPYLQTPDDSEYAAIRRHILRGEGLVGLETKRVRRDGSVIDVAISTAPLRNGDGELTGTVALVGDISERKRAEAEVHRLNQELEARVAERTAHLEQEIAERVRAEAAVKELNATLAEQAEHLVEVNNELETFTYSVSHDLKAPLRGIDGYSRLLLEDYADRLDEEGQYFLNTIRSATTQMAQLIDDLLSYSRLERRTLAKSQVDVRNLVETLLFQMQPAQVYPQTTIEVKVEPTLVRADADALALVLRNLIDNALKFSANAPAPRVEIGGESSAECYRLFVRDNGVGFDMQYQERIFDIFQRLHRSEEYPGTGIGLAMVRKALQRMHGRVWVESQPGQGATFTVILCKS